MDGDLLRDGQGFGGGGTRWPAWARVVVSGLLLFHASAIWFGAWAPEPSSELQRWVDAELGALPSRDGTGRPRGLLQRYQDLIRQGYSYRYYSPEPPPTPVVTATLRFADGRPDEVVRLPERGTRPRLRYQRQLALANALMADYQEARHFGDGSKSRWGRAFATHLGKVHPGCNSVTLRGQLHLVPRPERVRELIAAAGPVDLDAEEFYTAPERIGVYPCDAS